MGLPSDETHPVETPDEHGWPPEERAKIVAQDQKQKALYRETRARLRGDAPGFEDGASTTGEPSIRAPGVPQGADHDVPAAGDDEMKDEAMDDAVPEDAQMGFLGSLEPEPSDVASEMLLAQLGSAGRTYRREAKQGYRRLVSEIYSPPRVTDELKQRPRRHLMPGFALDLTVLDPEDGEPWDFCRPEKREKARRLRRHQRPYLLIGSPMCTAFSTWQALNEAKSADPAYLQREKIRAELHM